MLNEADGSCCIFRSFLQSRVVAGEVRDAGLAAFYSVMQPTNQMRSLGVSGFTAPRAIGNATLAASTKGNTLVLAEHKQDRRRIIRVGLFDFSLRLVVNLVR